MRARFCQSNHSSDHGVIMNTPTTNCTWPVWYDASQLINRLILPGHAEANLLKISLCFTILITLIALSISDYSRAQRPNDIIAPNPNLVTTEIPPITAELARTVGRYAQARSASFLGWRTGDNGMLIGTRFGNTPQVHHVATPGGTRKQLTFFKEPVSSVRMRPGRDHTFTFVRDIGGDEFFQIYNFETVTSTSTLLSDGHKRHSRPIWTNDGLHLAYSRVDANEKGAFTQIHLVEPDTPGGDSFVTQLDGGSWSVVDFSADLTSLILNEYISINESNLWKLDLESRESTLLTKSPGNVKVANRGGKFSADETKLYITTDAHSEFRKLALLDTTDGSTEILTSSIDWDVSSFELSPDGRTIAFVTNEAGIGVLHLLDTATKKITEPPYIPVGTIGGIKWHESKPLLGFTLASAKTPGDAYSVNVKSGALTRWTHSETGPIFSESFLEPELIKWKSFDGLEITGFLYRPNPHRFKGKRPVLMNIHGGPEGQSRPRYLGQTNYFVQELGMAVILPNVRGSSGYGKSYLKLDNGFKREDSYKDIEALLDWIEEEPTLDEDRVVVRGGSYGGFMTLAVSTYYSDRIACSVDIVGISNLRTFLENTQGYRRDLRRAEYGDERDPKMREFLDRTAPLTNAHLIKKPMLVIQGKNDPRVPKSESDQIVKTIRENEVPVWYLVANDEGHGFKKKANSDFAFYTTATFIQQHIQE